MDNCLKLKDIFKSYVDLDDFIFKRIKTSHNNIKYYTDTLDFEYIYSHSGNKYISPLVEKLLKDDNTITTLNLNKLVNIIYNKFNDKWGRLFDVLTEKYEPLENYNMYEIETPNIKREKTTGTNVDMNVDGSGSNQSNVFGFNTSSDKGVPNAIAEGETSSNTIGNEENNFTNIIENENGNKVLERNGNIGVTSSQQLLEQEIEVRKNNIYNIMYEDLDDILTLSIY